MPYPGLLHLEALPCGRPLLTRTSTEDAQTQFSLSLWAPRSWYAQGLFEPSERLWQGWGLILNANSAPLPSCWGFSFALGRAVSPHCLQQSAAAAPDLGCGVSPHGRSLQRRTAATCSSDVNQIPYDYTLEVRNRFKGLGLIERLKNYGWKFMTL